MVAACAQRGYESTSVSELLRLSGLARASFYAEFDNKEECFTATLEALLKGSITVVARAYESDEEWPVRARAGLSAFLELVAAQPAAARLCLIEAHAAGPAGIEPVQAAFDSLVALAGRALEQMPEREGTPEDLARAIIGGLNQVVQRYLQEDRQGELQALGDDLWEWAMAYRPPPAPLRLAARRRRIDSSGPPPFAAYDTGERIIRGFAGAVAEKGYGTATIADVAERASVSQRTIYEHFVGKRELLRAALDSSGAQLCAATLPAIRRSAGWPHSVRAGFGATCAFLAAEPDFARLRSVEVYAAGPEALAMRDAAGMEVFTAMLAGSDLRPPDPIVFEAVLGAVYAVLQDTVRRHGPERLPEIAPLLTYVTLAPLLGPGSACEVANGDGRRH